MYRVGNLNKLPQFHVCIIYAHGFVESYPEVNSQEVFGARLLTARVHFFLIKI